MIQLLLIVLTDCVAQLAKAPYSKAIGRGLEPR